MEWKTIANYNEMYEVSDTGLIRSKTRLIQSTNGRMRLVKGREIKPKTHSDGYLFVSLSMHGKARNYYIHRLVAIAFIINSENKPQVNHKDGNKKHNHESNLEWVSIAENSIHAYKSGLCLNKGHNHKEAKKVIDTSSGKTFGSIKEAATELGLNYSTLRNKLNGSNTNNTSIKYAA